MIKTLTNLFKQDKEKFVVPKGVQDVIPIKAIYDDGIFQVGKDKFSKSFKFTDINYAVASREDKEAMFLEYSELLNSFDSGATTKITINNRRLNRLDFEKTILLPLKGDELDVYREEYNKMLLEKATGANAIVQDKYIIDNKTQKAIEGIKGLGDYKNGNEIPCVLSFAGQKDYPVVAYLDDSFLKVPQESFVGDVTILCKIQRKINKGSSVELTDFFKSIKELPLNGDQRRAMNTKDLTMPKELSDTIKGPAFVVIPIAIYK